jgi:hypothetical protein
VDTVDQKSDRDEVKGTSYVPGYKGLTPIKMRDSEPHY